MREDRGKRSLPPATYYYRRPLTLRELAPAIGVAIGAGAAAFYLARTLLQRTAVVREPGITMLDERGVMVRRPRVAKPGGRTGRA